MASARPTSISFIDEILVDAYGEDEQFWAFRQAFEDNVTVSCDGFVVGEPVCPSSSSTTTGTRAVD